MKTNIDGVNAILAAIGDPQKPMNQNKTMNITKITIGRLYNLGSYEHIRYELTAEVPAGESPATAMIGLERIINALSPKLPGNCVSQDDEARKRREIAAMKELSDENFDSRYLYTGKVTRTEYMVRTEADLAEGVTRRQQWEARGKAARKLLDDLGGAANWRDAKLDWEDDHDFEA